MRKRAHTDILTVSLRISSLKKWLTIQELFLISDPRENWKYKKKEEVLKKGLALIGRQIFFHDINELKK